MHRPLRRTVLALAVCWTAACSASGDGTATPPTADRPATSTSAVPTDDGTSTTTPAEPDDDPTTTEVAAAEILDADHPRLLVWGDVSLAVPETYDVFEVDGDHACVSPTDPADHDFCDGIEIARGDALDVATNGTPYDGDQGDFAWYAGSDVPRCNPVYDDTALVEASTLGGSDTREVGGVEAEDRWWDLTCSNGADLVVRQWHLPDAGLLLTNRGGSIMDPIVLEHLAIDG